MSLCARLSQNCILSIAVNLPRLKKLFLRCENGIHHYGLRSIFRRLTLLTDLLIESENGVIGQLIDDPTEEEKIKNLAELKNLYISGLKASEIIEINMRSMLNMNSLENIHLEIKKVC